MKSDSGSAPAAVRSTPLVKATRISRARRERRLLQTMRESAGCVVSARKSLRRTGELLEARSKVIVSSYSDDGLELYDRIALSADDRLMNIRSARVWCARVENDLQHLRAMLDRAIDIAEGGTS